jgi:hypothetical protein
MRVLSITLAGLLASPGVAHAIDCAGVPQALPVRPTVLAPIASELVRPTGALGAQSSVLSLAYDEAQSVDQVLLRLRIESCHAMAMALPAPSAIDPNDPAAYKPKTEFDNTPWRFDMSQNGKRMTADEFSAWMKARGVRVARGAAPAVVPAAPGVVDPAASGAAAPAAPGAAPPAPVGVPPGTLPPPTTSPPITPAPAPATPAPEASEKPTTP